MISNKLEGVWGWYVLNSPKRRLSNFQVLAHANVSGVKSSPLASILVCCFVVFVVFNLGREVYSFCFWIQMVDPKPPLIG